MSVFIKYVSPWDGKEQVLESGLSVEETQADFQKFHNDGLFKEFVAFEVEGEANDR